MLSATGSPRTPAQPQESAPPSKPLHHALGELANRQERVMAASAKFARSGFTSPFGKLGAVINGIQLPIEIEEIHRRRAAEAHLPFREYLREVLCIVAVGRQEVQRAAAQRVDAIAGKLQE